MWIYLFIILFYIYALYKERQALGCPTIPNGTDCDNANGNAVRGTRPLPSDSNSVVFDKMRKAADFAERWVVWRIAFLLTVPCVLLIYFFIYQNVPMEYELLVGTFVITAVVYFAFNFYKFHLIDYTKRNIDEGVRILQTRIPS